jgi:hypothetical protein
VQSATVDAVGQVTVDDAAVDRQEAVVAVVNTAAVARGGVAGTDCTVIDYQRSGIADPAASSVRQVVADRNIVQRGACSAPVKHTAAGGRSSISNRQVLDCDLGGARLNIEKAVQVVPVEKSASRTSAVDRH